MFFKKFFAITDQSYLSALSQAGSIGLHMVSGVAVGAVTGYLLDKWLDTRPWCTAIFLVVGIVAGFKNVYVDTKRLVAKQREEDDSRYSGKPGPEAGTPAEHNVEAASVQGVHSKESSASTGEKASQPGAAKNDASAPEN